MVKLTQEFKLKLLLGIYIVGLLSANFLGNKIWEIQYNDFFQSIFSIFDIFTFQFGNQTIVPFSSTSLSFSVALFVFPLTFLITDVVAEVKGKKAAQEIFYVGLVCLGITLLYTILAVNLPAAVRYDQPAFPGANFKKTDAYNYIFSSSLRIMIGSFTAFLISQSLDILIFKKLAKFTGSKKLWLRNNLSTMISQFVDTAIFYVIAFAKLPFAVPFLEIEAGSGLEWDFMLRIFIPYYIFKVLFAALDTPLVYLGVKWLENKNQNSK